MSETEQLIHDLKVETDALKARFANTKQGKFTTVKFTKDPTLPRSLMITGYSGFGVAGDVNRIIALLDFVGVKLGEGPVWAFIRQNSKALGYVSVQ